MICGIGIDIIRIERMKNVVEKWGEKFLKRVFTDKEISYCYARSNPYLSLSVRFAAKEAMIKAMGSTTAVFFTDIEIVNSDTGKPALRTSDRLQDLLNARKIRKAHLSLSHEQEYGVASVVLEE